MSYHYTICGTRFYVSDKHDDFIRSKRWHMCGKYVATYVDGVRTYLHTILGRLKGIFGIPDHFNRDRMNNADDNLRDTTHSESNANRGMRRDNTSGYWGVDWFERRNKWRARITFESKQYYLGLYKNKEGAAYAWDLAIIFFRGPETSNLNLPQNRENYIQIIEDNDITNIYRVQIFLKRKFE